LAELGDVYVNDAFGSAHRAHASTEGARYLKPAVAGLLMDQELRYLGATVSDPKRPFVAVLGGAKISGKIDVIESLLPKVDRLIVGGAMACTFFKAMGLETGKSLVENDRVDMAKQLLARGGTKLELPIDASVASSLDDASRARNVAQDAIPSGEAMFDIGTEARSDRANHW
jgi:phosphoglycerate kinase